MNGNIKTIEIGEEKYPPLLKCIENPPERLYYIGDISLASKGGVAIVGSRKSSAYGKWAAVEISTRLAESNMVIVSGMASGIDSEAHKGALKAEGKTIAVMGCGIDICFPAHNRRLREDIAEKGLLLSEYPPGYPASRFTFPLRNRIISGLSLATVVVEAGISSGSLITAERAAEQNRLVFAVPGNINSIYSVGTNKLIQDGAYPVAAVNDIFDVLGLPRKIQNYSDIPLGNDEKRILKLVEEEGEISADRISQKVKLKISEVNAIITILEIKGIVSSALGKIFIAN